MDALQTRIDALVEWGCSRYEAELRARGELGLPQGPMSFRIVVPTQAPADETRTGRSPHGRLRNFRAMSETKFAGVVAAVWSEGNDPEAREALLDELLRRAAA